MEEVKKHLNGIDQNDWIKKIEQRTNTSLLDSWSVLEELRSNNNNSIPAPDYHSFIINIKVFFFLFFFYLLLLYYYFIFYILLFLFLFFVIVVVIFIFLL